MTADEGQWRQPAHTADLIAKSRRVAARHGIALPDECPAGGSHYRLRGSSECAFCDQDAGPEVAGLRLLETHGCQGGAHAGYVRAGWDVTGVDIDRRHARYYPGKLIIGDAATVIRDFGHLFDAIHASPPCQWYTRGNAKGRAEGNSKWERTIPAIRDALASTGRPYVIENVTDAGWDMLNPVETNWPLTAPRPCDHARIEWWAGAYGGARRDKYEAKYVRRGGYVPPDKDVVKALLGVEHDMTWNGLYECLPPAYTEHVGTRLLAHVRQEIAA